MKHKKNLILLSLLFSIFLFLVFPQKAEAKYINHTTTPTELRGTWYIGSQKAIQIYKHSIHIGKNIISPNRKGRNKLYVTYYNYKGLRNVYDFGKPDSYTPVAHSVFLGGYWLTNKKIDGQKVMASYLQMGIFYIYTKNKTNINYSFGSNNVALGSKNRIMRYINKNQKHLL